MGFGDVGLRAYTMDLVAYGTMGPYGFYTMNSLMGSVVETLWALFSFSFCRVSEGCVTWGLI